jgi:hypothetical protein
MTHRVLITGGRAPAAIDLGRALRAAGAEVFVSDSLPFYIARGSRAFSGAFQHTSPRASLAGFISDLNGLITRHAITALIPTCEEVFWLARLRHHLPEGCALLADTFEALTSLHNKWTFQHMIEGCGARSPATTLLTSPKDLAPLQGQGHALVVKPVFSRFAAQTLIQPTDAAMRAVRPSPASPWVAQAFIQGQEICAFILASRGQILARAAYLPTYRVGQGASVFFTPTHHPALDAFLTAFAARHHLHGQLAFDIIQAPDGQLYPLECNPRSTSGLHLLCTPPLAPHLGAAFLTATTSETATPDTTATTAPISPDQTPQMISVATLLLSGPAALRRSPATFLRDWARAQDVMGRPGDPSPSWYQLYVTMRLLWAAWRQGVSTHQASSLDIEWNGEDIPDLPSPLERAGRVAEATPAG